MQATDDTQDINLWIGKEEAFGLIATGCSAARAECIRRIKESGCYQQLNLTWADYCTRHLGMSRVTADQMIADLRDLGKGFFQMRRLMHISRKDYRRIQPIFQGENIEIEGRLVPITAENAVVICRAVLRLQAEATEFREMVGATSRGVTILAHHRMLTFTSHLLSIASRADATPQELNGAAGIARKAIEKLTVVLDRCNTPRGEFQ